ncbi:tRNA-uridine aminocarboxypropyltransferase 2-like [Impatiens glandulifera]|uniref:tRNA-uridine aminocarboxypropyltransferase 2-like n=1 Tax=Impatiens glandulifera TaxID=253017 RepID=UPI001FB0F3AE|nr:tRNA-uridine aminocarboxypropyltransferase 2-like [Impatiens glandulifera]
MAVEESGSPPDTITTTGDDLFSFQDSPRRRRCTGGCDRPVSVCLCDTIPKEPILTGTQVLILQHPHEQRHKLATVPVLVKCLRNCTILVGRRLCYGHSPLLDSLHDAAVENPDHQFRSIYLFPGTNSSTAVEIGQFLSSPTASHISNYMLIAFDGTWKHAKEMVDASLPFLSKFAVPICLDYDEKEDGGTMFDSDLILRKEPFSGCKSTLEAIARILHYLEPNGAEIEDKLVQILRVMVGFQSCNLRPTKPRPKLLRKCKREKNDVNTS